MSEPCAAFHSSGDHAGALDCFKQLGKRVTAVDLFYAAVSSRHVGDGAGAARFYRRAMKKEPRMAEAYLNLGSVVAELGEFEEAAAAYARGLRMREWDARTAAASYNNLGAALRELGRHDEAERHFATAVARNPELAAQGGAGAGVSQRYVGLVNRANERFMRGAYAESIPIYRSAVALPDARRDGSAYVGLGGALVNAQKHDEAVAVLAAGAELHPASPDLLANLAQARTEVGQFRDAAAVWTRALRLQPASPPTSYRAAAGVLEKVDRVAEAVELLRAATTLDEDNWQHHYALAHTLLHHRRHDEALLALRPLHRAPISMAMRAKSRAVPAWMRDGGRGLAYRDQPPPLPPAGVWERQAARRDLAAAAGRQSGVILYKLGPKESELDNLVLSLTQLTTYFNGAYRYPIVVAHDLPFKAGVRQRVRDAATGAPSLTFVRVRNELPPWLPKEEVPATVLGFPVDYRCMIRWKAGLMWEMPELSSYEYVWMLDTDAFILGPISYDPFAVMAAKNATYGYIDVNVETPEVAGGLADCVEEYLADHPRVRPTLLRKYKSGGKWDGSKFYTNFQVARLDYGRSEGYRRFFDHVDRNGGIFRHRWGNDPFAFLAASILLRDDQIVHFDDVPYLHQHLLANLPDAVMGDITERIAPYEEPTEDDEDGEDGAAAADDATPGEVQALLFLASAAHAAAAVAALRAWNPGAAACGDASCRQRLGCRLRLHAVSSPALGADATSAAFLAELPSAVELAAPLAVLPSTDDGAGDDDAVRQAASVLAAVGSELRRLHRSSARARPPLLLLCIDSADGATLAAAAAAVAVGAPALNVCDDAAALGFDGVPRARDGRRLLDRAAGCNAPVVQEIEATI